MNIIDKMVIDGELDGDILKAIKMIIERAQTAQNANEHMAKDIA